MIIAYIPFSITFHLLFSIGFYTKLYLDVLVKCVLITYTLEKTLTVKLNKVDFYFCIDIHKIY